MNKIAEIKLSYSSVISNKIKIISSSQASTVFKENWNMDTIELQEEAKILYLSQSNHVLGILPLSKGGTRACIVDIKLVLVSALKSNAQCIIMAHNHPSGNLKPSDEDIRLTKRFIEATKSVDLKLLDHLIITKDGYFSLADEGLI